jgi:hypothetical protein
VWALCIVQLAQPSRPIRNKRITVRLAAHVWVHVRLFQALQAGEQAKATIENLGDELALVKRSLGLDGFDLLDAQAADAAKAAATDALTADLAAAKVRLQE